MKEFIKHLFIPHHTNNQRAKVLHHSSVFFVVGFLLVQSFLLSHIKTYYPRVLGNSVNMSSQELLLLTNQKRVDAGIAPLVLNDKLTKAAQAKAVYMFQKDFWAHNAPDGRTPWDFIKDTGYPYIYAGENLARGFTDSQDVVNAWLASPEHRENMLSSNYQEVGFAVQRGDLTGEKNTVLVVEMFGNTSNVPVASNLSKDGPVKSVLNKSIQNSQIVAAIKYQPWFDSTTFVKNVSIFFLSLFLFVLIIDMLVVKRKGIVRLFEHNLDHIMFLGAILIIVFILARGSIF